MAYGIFKATVDFQIRIVLLKVIIMINTLFHCHMFRDTTTNLQIESSTGPFAIFTTGKIYYQRDSLLGARLFDKGSGNQSQ